MKNLNKLTILSLLSFPSIAFACGGPSIIDIAFFLLVPILIIFFFFLVVGFFRDNGHQFRYAFLCTFPLVSSILLLFILSIFFENNDFIGFWLTVFYFLITGIAWAEYKVREGKE